MSIAETIKSVGARLTMGDDDVRALLRQDHDEVKDLLRDLVEGEQGRSRSQMLEMLKTKLTAHSRAEEKTVYDPLIRARAKRDVHVLAEEGYVEHGVVDDLLARVSRLQIGTELWRAHMKVIRELLESHISEEENQMFAQLGDVFSRDELVAMGRDFLRRKARVLTLQAPKAQRSVKRVVAAQRARKSAGRATAKKASRTKGKASVARRPQRAATRSSAKSRSTGRRSR